MLRIKDHLIRAAMKDPYAVGDQFPRFESAVAGPELSYHIACSSAKVEVGEIIAAYVNFLGYQIKPEIPVGVDFGVFDVIIGF